MSSNEDSKYCYLVSYRHPTGAGHMEIVRDQPWHPHTTNTIASQLANELNIDAVAITNVFYQGCYSTQALENLKRLAENHQEGKPNLTIVKD